MAAREAMTSLPPRRRPPYTATFARDTTPAPVGLVATYGFDELGGLTVSDRSPSANTGTINGATRVVGGRFGGALSFDGTDDWVTVPDAASLDLTGGMTLEAWVRPATTNADWRTALLKEQPGGLSSALYSATDTGPPAGYVNIGSDRGTAAAPRWPRTPGPTWPPPTTAPNSACTSTAPKSPSAPKPATSAPPPARCASAATPSGPSGSKA